MTACFGIHKIIFQRKSMLGLFLLLDMVFGLNKSTRKIMNTQIFDGKILFEVNIR